jgi:lipopolysaccharide export system protein LptA
MSTWRNVVLPLLAAIAVLAPHPAWAERADRDKPVNIEADRITVDDAKKIQVFEGNVQLSQGTLVIRAEKLVVTQDANGYQKGVAYAGGGRAANFRQKRDGKDEYVEGDAERIEHDSKAEKTELFNKAHIKSGLDEVHGQYISYDAKSENYLVSGSTPAGTTQSAPPERVRAVIQPKNKEADKPAPH